MDYVYELRESGAVVATGRLVFGRALTPGDEMPFGGDTAIVKEVRPSLDGITRLILELRT